MSVVENLRKNLAACEAELPNMKTLLEKLKQLIANKDVTEDTKKILEERRDQLTRDIDNYEHMLEEANDLKKAWDKSDSDMIGIKQDANFQDSASVFESTVDLSAASKDATHSTFKEADDRVSFDNLGAGQGGEIKNLPIVFDFGLLKQHKMGGWETGDNEEEYFSFTFKWEDDQFIKENPDKKATFLDDLKIKATSVVVLYDDRTNRIVSFDVEPGFEHQWGYGRQRFMAKDKLSKKCEVARYRAIIKKHSDQHEYELGKYTMELLRQAKNQSVEVKDLVEFIAQQTEEEVKQTQAITKLKAELEVLKQTTTTKEEEITKLKLEISTLQVTKTEQETKIAELNEQLEQKIAEQAQQSNNSPGETDSQQVSIDWESRYKRVEEQLNDEKAAHEKTKEELAALEAKAEEALKAIQQLTADRDELKLKIDELESNVNKLIALIQTKDNEIEQLQTKLAEAEKEKEALNKENDTLEDEKKAAEDKVEQTTADLNTANDTIKTKDVAITALNVKITEKETEITEITAQHEETKKKLQIKNNALLDAKKRAQEAIKILQPLADMDLSDVQGSDNVEVEEETSKTTVTVQATKVKETTVEVNEVVVAEEVAVAQSAPEVQAEREPTPTPPTPTPPPLESEPVAEAEAVVEAERVPTPEPAKEDPGKGETTEEKDAEETVIQAERTPTPPPPQPEAAEDDEEEIVFSPVESTANDAEGDDIIQAQRVPTPQFFPAKPEDETLDVDNVSQKSKSRKSSTASQKAKINTPRSKKGMDKFDVGMGLKDKKKPSTMRKFINMCTGKSTTAKENIDEKPSDPQDSIPQSPTK